jgi:predicted kinase
MSALFPRLLVPPKQSFFLFGPRGTGKSTWVRTQFPAAHRIDLLDIDNASAKVEIHKLTLSKLPASVETIAS